MNVQEYEAMYRVEDTLWWYVGMREISAAVLDGRLRPGMTILDAGCGTGGNAQWLGQFGRTYGVDLSPLAVRFCARRRLSRISRASVLCLPFPNGTFDLVTSFDVIYHLDVSDDVAALREMRRVLKPGGWALVRVPALEQLRSGHDEAVHTRQRYTLAELKAKTKRAGLQPARCSYVNSLLFPVAAASRLAARLTDRGETHASDVRPAPPALDAIFHAVMRVEAKLVANVDLPLGLSALVVARRPADEVAA